MTKQQIPIKNVTSNTTETIDLYQHREKIYRRGGIKGLYQNIRVYSGWFLILMYFIQPWLQWSGRQAVYFDLSSRQFYVYGMTFWPQDFILLSSLLIICAFGLFFITVFAGRVWCGYTCPQTAWTFAFMWIEELCEGSPNQRRKRDKAKLTTGKFARKSIKHSLWLGYGLITALTFVGYFSPIRNLVPNLFTFNVDSWEAFWILFFTLATYINAGWLREQVCIYMCPYARFQSVMFDKDTLIVAYDEKRGESRGSRKRGNKPENLGDCIDCGLCVQVCPTGIDIRNGLQYECIDCACCIDACNSIMEKMNYEPNLISYTTENTLEGKTHQTLRPRLIGYGSALLLMVAVFSYIFVTRTVVDVDISRDRRNLFQINPQGLVENHYNVHLMNKTQKVQSYTLELNNQTLNWIGPKEATLNPGEVQTLLVTLTLPAKDMERLLIPIEFLVTPIEGQGIHDDPKTQRIESRFFGPTPTQ